jgi:hypothetical protein
MLIRREISVDGRMSLNGCQRSDGGRQLESSSEILKSFAEIIQTGTPRIPSIGIALLSEAVESIDKAIDSYDSRAMQAMDAGRRLDQMLMDYDEISLNPGPEMFVWLERHQSDGFRSN